MAVERNQFDVIVVGGGIAGASTSRCLGRQGLRVALVEKQSRPSEKSLFINGDNKFPQETLQWLSDRKALIPCPNFLLVNADHPERNMSATPNNGNTHAVFHEPIIRYNQEGFTRDTEVIKDRVVKSIESADGVAVSLSNSTILTANQLVDATGNFSQLSRIHQVNGHRGVLNDDPWVLWLRGIRAYGDFQPGVLIDPIGRQIGLSWILPYSSDYGDIIAANCCRLSEINPYQQQKVLSNLIDFCRKQGLCYIKSVEMRLNGFIRSQPIPKSAASKTNRLYAIGEAAGMGSPLMSEVVPAALHWGEELPQFIQAGKTPTQFYDQWRHKNPMFPYDIELAMLRRRLNNQAKGNYGSNAAIYQALMSGLPESVQKQVLTERRVPLKYWPQFGVEVLRRRDLLPNLAELAVEYARVKVDYLRENQ